MPRSPRIQQAGACYHIVARGMERAVIFRRDRDYQHFLELLEKMSSRFACEVFAYVLMGNHFQLFMGTREANLSRAVQWLTTAYAAGFNVRSKRAGPLFQGRFKAVLVDPEEWALDLSRYIHLNPVRTTAMGLDKASRRADRQGVKPAASRQLIAERLNLLRQFKWSSYRVYAGYEAGPGWLDVKGVLQRCGGTPAQQRQWYRDYCQQAIREGMEIDIWQGLVDRICLGSREFLDEALAGKGGNPVFAQRRSGAQIRQALEKVRGQRWRDMAGRHGDWSRDLAMYLMRECSGERTRTIAQECGLSRASSAVMAMRRFEQRLAKDKAARQCLESVKKALQLQNNS